jgi:hypothetical protein
MASRAGRFLVFAHNERGGYKVFERAHGQLSAAIESPLGMSLAQKSTRSRKRLRQPQLVYICLYITTDSG